jgi:WXG100 family type VII secretion target
MSSNIIQAQYEALEALAQKFGQQAEMNGEMYGRVQKVVQALEQGGWEGQGSSAFFAEMDGTIYPALQRLINALEEAQSTTLQIKEIIQQAEEEAAAPFGGRAAEGGSPVTAPGAVGPPGTVSGTPVDPNNPLVARDPHSLFTDGYMDSIVDSKINGEDSQRLNNAMKDLAKNPTGAELNRVINEIADIRGVPADQLRADYEKFLQIREQARQIARQKGIDPPEAVDDFFHGEFMGSTAQLRYGQVVGDAFGIDPVFGAMLNPTGGMVGPGNWAVNPGDDDAIGYHGIVHDAAGYLYNFHDLGPGYDYLGQESHRDPGNPLVGQQSGVRYWNEKLNPGLVTDISHGVGDFVIDNTERVIDTVDSGIDAVQDFGGRAVDFVGDAAEDVGEFLEFVF